LALMHEAMPFQLFDRWKNMKNEARPSALGPPFHNPKALYNTGEFSKRKASYWWSHLAASCRCDNEAPEQTLV